MFLLDIGETITSWVESFIENVFFRVLYYGEMLILWALSLVEDMMRIFTGEQEVTYNGRGEALVNVFFNNDAVKGVYGAMAMIGIVFSFVFAIIAVIRKLMDVREKQQGVTLGGIIGNLVKSILLIAGMNAVMLVVMYTTNILITQVSYAFQNGSELAKGSSTIQFTDEQYAAMGRILNTIGNYSLNPSYRSRYNLNACYNDIRTDLKYLGDQGVFRFHYETTDNNDNIIPTWQSIMEELAIAYDYTQEVPLDTYDEGLTNAILDAMELMKANPNIVALDTYERKLRVEDDDVPLDRILFLTGTMGTIGTAAARNDAYNKNPSFADSVRQPFYYGTKDIYDWDQVKEVFSLSPFKMNYILVYYASWMILNEMVVIIIACGVRIFNLLALYLAAPLVIAAMPLDDGGKLKQWTTAFTVQLLGVVGLIISLRLFYMMLPLIWSPNLSIGGIDLGNFSMDKLENFAVGAVQSEDSLVAAGMAAYDFIKNLLMTVVLKVVLTYTALEAVSRMNGIFTGILADSAGYQSISAGDVRRDVQDSGFGQLMGKMMGRDSLNKAFYDREGEQEKKQEKKEKEQEAKQAKKEKEAEQKEKMAQGRNNDMASLQDSIESGKDESGKKLSDKDMEITQGALRKMKSSDMSKKDAMKAAGQDYEKKQARSEQNQKDMKKLQADLDNARETGKTMDGKETDGKERDIMAGTLKHMQDDGMSKAEARKAAEADYNKSQKEQDEKNKFHQAELKAAPANRNKAIENAKKMDDDQYKTMRREYAYMQANNTHTNGDAIKPGESGLYAETLKQYEDRQLGVGAFANDDGGAGGNADDDAEEPEVPDNQNNQV